MIDTGLFDETPIDAINKMIDDTRADLAADEDMPLLRNLLRLLYGELHKRALQHHQAHYIGRDTLRNYARDIGYDHLNLRHRNATGYQRAVYMDELHGRAITLSS